MAKIALIRYVGVLILMCTLSTAAQEGRYTDWWHFGRYAGVHFTDTGPEAFYSSAMRNMEGSASMCDSQGELLFYSSGNYVWNRLDQLMPHGDSIHAYSAFETNAIDSFGNSSTNGVIVIPIPNNNHQYYLFNHVAACWGIAGCDEGIMYNVIDMNSDSGFGDVVQRNIQLIAGFNYSERLAACRHANGRDWWLLARQTMNNTFVKWLITPYGIQGPFTQNVGSVFSTWLEDLGEMCFNKQGNLLGLVNVAGLAEVYYFDRCSGEISNPITLNTAVTWYGEHTYFYGCEFAPVNPIFYVAAGDSVYQWDLTDESNIIKIGVIANPLPLDTNFSDTAYAFGQMAIGPDDKLYFNITHGNSAFAYMLDSNLTSLSVINSPDVSGLGCDAQLNIFSHYPRLNWLGLPNFPNYNLGVISESPCDSLPPPTALFNADITSICVSNCINISDQSSLTEIYEWQFPGGTPNTSYLSNPQGICYNSPGTYDITLITFNGIGSDTLILYNYITVHALPDSTIMQINDSLFAVNGYDTYTWTLDGSPIENTTNAIPLQGNGTYQVVITDSNGCTSTESIVITGINDLVENSFNIYPNPSDDYFICNYTTTIQQAVIEVYDAIGRKLVSIPANQTSTKISTKQLSAGVYTVELKSNSQRLGISKWVKVE